MTPPSRNVPLAVLLAVLVAACETAPVSEPVPVEPAPPVSAQPEPQPEPVTPAPQPEPLPEPAPITSEEPEPPPATVVCEPPPVTRPEPAAPQRPATVLPILGIYESVSVDPPGLLLKARLDTGTSGSTLDAREAREFERDGKPWVKFLIADRETGQQAEVSRPLIRTLPARNGAKRYVVTLRTRLGGIDQFTEFVLVDRSGSSFPVVLGRDFLRDQALVDAARRYTVQPAKP